MLLSIIIINYNTPHLTQQAVHSIIKHVKKTTFEIIVVNNGNKKDYYHSDKANVILTEVENKGFGHACNRGADIANGNVLLFLNPDTLQHENTIDLCADYLSKHQDIGVLGVRTLRGDGTLDHACKRGFPTPFAALCYFLHIDKIFPNNRRIGAYQQTFVRDDALCDVDAISGSFMMIPRRVFEAVARFDESFFMYGEDLDICYRVKSMGHRVFYYGGATMTHFKGQSGLHAQSQVVIEHFYNAMLLFYNKHYRNKHNRFGSLIIAAGIRVKRALAINRRGTQ